MREEVAALAGQSSPYNKKGCHWRGTLSRGGNPAFREVLLLCTKTSTQSVPEREVPLLGSNA
jgi:hypothetical protein